jgi:hypothetical protein
MSKHDEKLEQKSKTAISGALDDKDLNMVSGGDKTVVKKAHDDEGPKETVTFEYGALIVKYGSQ